MQQIIRSRSVSLVFNNFPYPQRVVIGILTIFIFFIAVWQHYYHSDNSVVPFIKSIKLDKLELHALLPKDYESIDQSSIIREKECSRDEADGNIVESDGEHEYTIASGDTLSSVLNQYGIDIADVNALASSDRDLYKFQVGQQLSWIVNDHGDLNTLIWKVSRREIRTYERNSQGAFSMKAQFQKGEWLNKVIQGDVQRSFVNSAYSAGLNNIEIDNIIKAMQWQLDFRKLRSDTKFSVLISREILESKSAQSQLLGVHLRSGRKDYYAFRADDGKFYDRNGSGLARGFMRFPMGKQYRISSNFNLHRLNPVTGRIAPHKGVDFALPVGTPVLAVGDGEVIVAKNGGAAGNYIAIRHGRQYMMRYMHLKKVLVKPGQKVKRGERIALSGNTGRSTGPHLHFEIWINNQAVNPLTAKLPRMEGLTGKKHAKYMAKVKGWLPQVGMK